MAAPLTLMLLQQQAACMSHAHTTPVTLTPVPPHRLPNHAPAPGVLSAYNWPSGRQSGVFAYFVVAAILPRWRHPDVSGGRREGCDVDINIASRLAVGPATGRDASKLQCRSRLSVHVADGLSVVLRRRFPRRAIWFQYRLRTTVTTNHAVRRASKSYNAVVVANAGRFRPSSASTWCRGQRCVVEAITGVIPTDWRWLGHDRASTLSSWNRF